MSTKQPGPWHVLTDTYRRKHVYVVARLAGPRGRVEYLLSERTGKKERYFLADYAQRKADEANARATGAHHE
jgi:hypothetical protein